MEFTVESEVSADGMVHITAPDLRPGDRVTVTVEKKAVGEGEQPKERVFGRWKGKIEILPGFDDPIEGLEWAYP